MGIPYAIMTNVPRSENVWPQKISSDESKKTKENSTAKTGEPSYDFKTKEGIKVFIEPYMPKAEVGDSRKREQVFSELNDVLEKAKPQNKEEAKAALRIYLRIKDIEIKSKGRISISDVQIEFKRNDPLCDHRVFVKVTAKVIGSDNKARNFSFERTPSASNDGENSFIEDFEKKLEDSEVKEDNKPIAFFGYSVDSKTDENISKIYEIILRNLEKTSKRILDTVLKPEDPSERKRREQIIAKKRQGNLIADKQREAASLSRKINIAMYGIPDPRVLKTLNAKLNQAELDKRKAERKIA